MGDGELPGEVEGGATDGEQGQQAEKAEKVKSKAKGRSSWWERPFLFFTESWGRAAWGRSCGSAKLLAGTLRCLHLCRRLPWDWSDAEQLGRCPKPQQGRCPCTLQGTLSLDPFWQPGLGALSLLQLLRQKRNAYSLLIFSINAVTFRSGVAHEVHTRSATWLSSTRS